MGYTFTIGNAVPHHSTEDFPYLSARWEVEPMEHPDAPDLPNDFSGKHNERSPSYSVWSDFLKEVGLYDLLMSECGFPIGGHPGCSGLTREMADRISEARRKFEEKAVLPPGFEPFDHTGPAKCDYTLARLIWLDWWVRWAVDNCKTPAISNI